jgi:membrane associated rhomboid family serine protease
VLAIIAICALMLVGQTFLLTDDWDNRVVFCLGFVPARYNGALIPCPLGTGAEIFTFVTYAFLHGDAIHLAMNTVWFLPFGSAVARRFGTLRTSGFFIATAAGGALVYLFAHWGDSNPMIGASGAVSGFMAGTIRFAIHDGGPLTVFRRDAAAAYFVPAPPLSSALRDSRMVGFLAIWLGLNVLFGLFGGGDGAIAWEAHVGGFLAGLLLFPLFDPVPARKM